MSENQIVVYQPNETVRLDVRLENETVWLNQSRIGELFGVDRTVVNRHIHNIYKTGELDEPSTCAKIAQVQKEGRITVEPEGMRLLAKLERWVRRRRSECPSEGIRRIRRGSARRSIRPPSTNSHNPE